MSVIHLEIKSLDLQVVLIDEDITEENITELRDIIDEVIVITNSAFSERTNKTKTQ
jgi:hypothetical protein